MDLVILIGLQGSGKTSFRKARLAEGHVQISKDDWPNARRREERQQRRVAEALAAGQSVVVDNTSPAPSDRVALIGLARAAGARVVGYFFESDPRACWERNAKREGRACVPERAFRRTLGLLTPPCREEGFDALYRVRLVEGGFDVQPLEAPDATR